MTETKEKTTEELLEETLDWITLHPAEIDPVSEVIESEINAVLDEVYKKLDALDAKEQVAEREALAASHAQAWIRGRRSALQSAMLIVEEVRLDQIAA